MKKNLNKIYTGVIYKYTNLINKKTYVGQTVREGLRRKEHFRAGMKGREKYLFDFAISKYSINNFKYEVLFRICNCGQEVERRLNFFEKFYISKFKSNDPVFGYNLTAGGMGSLGRIISEETREKMRQNHANFKGANSPLFGKKKTPEQIENSRKARLGKKLSEETKLKLSRIHKNKGTKDILCVETGIIYHSVLEASEKTQIGYSNLRKCA